MIPKTITSPDAPQNPGPCSPALKVGDFIFISGQVPLDATNQLVKSSITDQTLQVLHNLVALLAEMNLELRHIVKTTLYLTNKEYLDEVNQIYATYFSQPYPSRSIVMVNELQYGADIMLDATAVDTLSYEQLFRKNDDDDGPVVDCKDCVDGSCNDC